MNKQFAVCLILPRSISDNIGFYGLNSLVEYLHSHFDFSYLKIMNMIKF